MANHSVRARVEAALLACDPAHPDEATYRALLDARDRMEAAIEAAAEAVTTIREGLNARLRAEADRVQLLPEVIVDNQARDAVVEAVSEIAKKLPDGDRWLTCFGRYDMRHALDMLDDSLRNITCSTDAWVDQHDREPA